MRLNLRLVLIDTLILGNARLCKTAAFPFQPGTS